jgi:hypothetical protein
MIVFSPKNYNLSPSNITHTHTNARARARNELFLSDICVFVKIYSAKAILYNRLIFWSRKKKKKKKLEEEEEGKKKTPGGHNRFKLIIDLNKIAIIYKLRLVQD